MTDPMTVSTAASKTWIARLFIIAVAAVLTMGIVAGCSKTQSDSSTQSPTRTEDAEVAAEVAEPEPEPQTQAAPEVPIEYRNALKKADSYANMMHMSKAKLYDQLTSEYGEQFSPEAAQYAIDNVQTDWNANALAKAQSYQETMSMSPSRIYDQLTSEYGEQFTPEEAQYAIDHLAQ